MAFPCVVLAKEVTIHPKENLNSKFPLKGIQLTAKNKRSTTGVQILSTSKYLLDSDYLHCFCKTSELKRLVKWSGAGPDSADGSVYRLAFGSSQARFPGPAPFTSCQLLVKG